MDFNLNWHENSDTATDTFERGEERHGICEDAS